MDRYGKHIEKALTLTHYETPMTPIGYLIMDNQLYAKKWDINTTGLAITIIECQKGSAPPFSPSQCIYA